MWVPLHFILSGKNNLRLKIKRVAGGVDGPKFSTRDSKGDSSIRDSANMVYVVVRFVSVCSRMANTKATEGESYIPNAHLLMAQEFICCAIGQNPLMQLLPKVDKPSHFKSQAHAIQGRPQQACNSI